MRIDQGRQMDNSCYPSPIPVLACIPACDGKDLGTSDQIRWLGGGSGNTLTQAQILGELLKGISGGDWLRGYANTNDSSTGALAYDADGVGGCGAVTFATLGVGTHPATLGGGLPDRLREGCLSAGEREESGGAPVGAPPG